MTQRIASTAVCLLLAPPCLLAACGEDPAATRSPDAAAPLPDSADPTACFPRMPAPADRVRALVVSKPYNEASSYANTWEVLAVGLDGSITPTGKSFEMGNQVYGEIVWTPDGKVGMVAQRDGSIGVFRLADDLTPTTVHAKFKETFYASNITIDATGEYAYILDGNWRTNGGSIWKSKIACDGTLGTAELVVESKLAKWMFMEDATHGLVVARDVANSVATHDMHRLDLATKMVTAGSDAYGHDDDIAGGAAFDRARQRLWQSDGNQFSPATQPNVVVVLDTNSMAKLGAVEVSDPASVKLSPFADMGVVSSGLGNALVVIKADAGTYVKAGEVAYKDNAKPKIPTGMAMIDRGSLAGTVFVVENVSLRQLRFTAAGGIDDLGSYAFPGTSSSSIPGAIGVAP